MTPMDRQPHLSRRTALGLGVAALGTAVVGCSNEGRGVQPGPAASGGLQLPNSKPLPALEGAIFSKVEGVAPAFTKMPPPGQPTVASPPGKGSEITALTITWGVPPALDASNTWYTTINQKLGATLKPLIIPAQSFGDRLVTTIASGDIPAITTNEPSYRGRSARKYLPQGVFHDLRNFLGGDKVNKYPNLAMVPAYAWKNSLINGALYGVPCYRNQTVGGTLLYRADWAEKGGFGDKPKNAADVLAWARALKKGGGEGAYAFATLDQTFSFCGIQVHKAPNQWRVTSGKLVKDLETDEFEAGLAFARKLWEEGLVHPNMPALTNNSAEYLGQFMAGRVGVSNGSIDAYFGVTGQIAKLREREPNARAEVLIPPGHDGGVGLVPPDLGFYCMLSIPSSIKDEARIDELLGVINFLAAPPGSAEYFLCKWGIEGHNYTVKDGLPVAVKDGPGAGEGGFLSQLTAFTSGFFFPGAPAKDAADCQRYAEEMVAGFVHNPVANLDSETSFSKGDALSSLVTDYTQGIVTGRRPMSDLADLRKRWQAGGGDAMRAEFESQL